MVAHLPDRYKKCGDTGCLHSRGHLLVFLYTTPTVFRHLALHVFAFLGWIERVKTTFFIIFYFLLWKYENIPTNLLIQPKNKLSYFRVIFFSKYFFAHIKYSLQPLNSMAVGTVEIWQEVPPKKGRVINGKKEWKKGRGKLAVPAYKSFYTIIQWGKLSHWIPNKIKIGDISYTFLDFVYPFFITLLFFFFFYTLWTFHFIQDLLFILQVPLFPTPKTEGGIFLEEKKLWISSGRK